MFHPISQNDIDTSTTRVPNIVQMLVDHDANVGALNYSGLYPIDMLLMPDVKRWSRSCCLTWKKCTLNQAWILNMVVRDLDVQETRLLKDILACAEAMLAVS
jgi:hypothetical protein